MNEYRSVLERAGSNFAPLDLELERLLRRRDRKRRNQRITAGVVGIAVFVAAVWVVTSVGSLDQSQTEGVPGGAVTGPAVTGPAQPTAIGTVTSSGGGCTLEIDAETIRAGTGRVTVVNETDRPVSFDLFRLTSVSVAGIEAFIASGEGYGVPLNGDRVPRPTGAFLRLRREVGPGASGTITDNFTTGAFAVVCAHPDPPNIFDVNVPFAVVGPIVVP